MSEPVLVIDFDKCTGCRACEIACSLANCGEANPEKSRIRIVKVNEIAKIIPVPVVCMHCENPPCETVCPMSAIFTDPSTKSRRINEEKCIGCSACVYACPFGAIVVDRSTGYAFTCNLCNSDPVCVKFCPTEALRYINSDEVSMRLKRTRLNKYVDFIKAEAK